MYRSLNHALSAVCLLVCLLSTATSAQTAERYVVTDFDTASAYVFNAADDLLVARIKAGVSPSQAAISSNGRLMYVVNTNSSYLSVIDVTIGAEIRRIPTGVQGRFVALSADGNQAVVVSVVSDEIKIVDTRTFAVQTVSVDGHICNDSGACDAIGVVDAALFAHVIANGKAYFTNQRAGRVLVLNLATHALTDIPGTAITGSAGRRPITATADGSKVFVGNRTGHILAINTATGTLLRDNVIPVTLPSRAAIACGSSVSSPVLYVAAQQAGAGVVRAYAIQSNGSLSLLGSSPSSVANPFSIGVTSNEDRIFITMRDVTNGNNLGVFSGVALRANSPALLSERHLGSKLDNISVGQLATAAPVDAPTIAGVMPNSVPNGRNTTAAERTFSIAGSFSAGATVRVGANPPVNPDLNTLADLHVTLPVLTPSQAAGIIVTDPGDVNDVANHFKSGIAAQTLAILSSPAFTPVNQALVIHFGESSIATLNVSTNADIVPVISDVLQPLAARFSADGSKAYINRFNPPSIYVYNAINQTVETHIDLSTNIGDATGQASGVALAPDPQTGKPALFAVFDRFDPGSDTNDLVIAVISLDADTPATYNTIVRTIPFGLTDVELPSSLAVTPDGHYAFTGEADFVSVSQLYRVDLIAGGVTEIFLPGVEVFQDDIEITPDGNYLLLGAAAGGVTVFDISNPLSPVSVGAFPGASPAITDGVSGAVAKVPASDPGHAFVVDRLGGVFRVTNFDPLNPNSAQRFQTLASANLLDVFPAATAQDLSTHFDITPDGKLAYLVNQNSDVVAVIDVTKLLAGNPDYLATRFSTGLGPSWVAVRPGTPTPTGTAVAVQPVENVALSFDSVTSGGTTTVATTNTSPVSAPAGFQLGDIPVYYEISSTAVFTGNVEVCFNYDPEAVNGPEADLRVAHYDTALSPPGWVDVTVLPVNTSENKICAQVTHFSPFAIGLGSTNFLYDSLVQAITNAIQPVGIMRSLRAKALASRAAFDRANNGAATNQLNALKQEIAAQSGNPTIAGGRDYLLGQIDSILARLQ